jgi:CTP:molybdopterin cytidylyltransferase MocA
MGRRSVAYGRWTGHDGPGTRRLARLGWMAVAAAIFAAQPESALADVGGVPAARHLAGLAHEAGVWPILVVSFDPEGTIAAAVDGVATLVDPVPPEHGPAAQLARGVAAAVAVDPAISAVLLWPARSTDATADTVRSLIAAHADDPEAIIRPGADDATGFPALFPVRHRAAFDDIAPDRMPGDILSDIADGGVPMRVLDPPNAG